MAGLIYKDCLLLIKNLKAIYFIALIPPLAVGLGNRAYFLYIFSLVIAFFCAAQLAVIMELDERCEWKKIERALPCSAEQIVLSKYLLLLALSMCAGILVLCVSSIYLKKISFIYAVFSFLFVFVYNSMFIPVALKFGTQTSKYFIMVFLSIPILLVYVLEYLNLNVMNILMNMNITLFLSPSHYNIDFSWYKLYLFK